MFNETTIYKVAVWRIDGDGLETDLLDNLYSNITDAKEKLLEQANKYKLSATSNSNIYAKQVNDTFWCAKLSERVLITA